jgi:hypothetical protein
MAGPERPDQPDGPPPFGEDDDSVLDVRLVRRQLEDARNTLQSVQARLTKMRYKPGPDQQVPEERTLQKGWTYDVWVHVWNLGQSQVSGVRVRLRMAVGWLMALDPNQPKVFLGGTTLDLGDRLSERAHRAVKMASLTIPGGELLPYGALLVATVDTLSDPSSGDRSPGADRHTAHRLIVASQAGPPQFG